MPDRKRTRRAATPAEAKALAHPLRLRIIRLTFDEALTNAELAARLQEQPATVLHHVRTLVRTGFLEPVKERPGPKGTTEKPYRSTGKSWTLDVTDPGSHRQVKRASLDAFLAELADAGEHADLSTSRLAVNLRPERKAELVERISRLLDEYASAPPDTDGERWSVFVALHRRA